MSLNNNLVMLKLSCRLLLRLNRTTINIICSHIHLHKAHTQYLFVTFLSSQRSTLSSQVTLIVTSSLHNAFSKTHFALGNKVECTPSLDVPTTIEAPELGIKMKVESPVIFIKPAILFRTVASSLAYGVEIPTVRLSLCPTTNS